jgi:hypothetical protein
MVRHAVDRMKHTVPVAPTPVSKDTRPLRQRLCRFVFKEFIRSCGLGSRLDRIQGYHLWQAVLAAGVVAVVVILI